MTLEQAIDRYTNNAEYERIHGSLQGCLDFRQLAEWLKELKRLREQTSWIPVSERLPEEGQWVMVTFDGKIAVCIAHDNDGTLREATSLVLKNATEIWLYPESEWGDGYAAWMPLPKPYEPQESEDKE